MHATLGLLALVSIVFNLCAAKGNALGNVLDNGVVGEPQVDCMEDRVKLTFRTEKPFNGRIFVKGMIESDKCVQNFSSANGRPSTDFEVVNGDCNMRRSRKISPEERGVEQSITIIISFHDTFITKVDRAYRCTCFYMEADKIVTNRIDVSALPTTDLVDTAKMPLCSYTVRRGSVNGPVVSYATVGEPVFHVWSCDSDMFSMLVHSCWVDDGAGNEKKLLIDEHGCSVDNYIVPDLNYNSAANLAFTEVNVFKFADKVTTYFQCAVSSCMISEGMCTGKTPPRCGSAAGASSSANFRSRSKRRAIALAARTNMSSPTAPMAGFDYTMDLNADKVVVFDLDDLKAENEAAALSAARSHRGMYETNEMGTPSFTFQHHNTGSMPTTAGVCLSQASVITLVVLTVIVMSLLTMGLSCMILRRRSGKF
uniref:ZP domain-containing protein n=1 Tax=Panagrellus redivivus TaxID=6233 RepID=A0A7E4VQV2_PANRE